jgi:hypothetical protein
VSGGQQRKSEQSKTKITWLQIDITIVLPIGMVVGGVDAVGHDNGKITNK